MDTKLNDKINRIIEQVMLDKARKEYLLFENIYLKKGMVVIMVSSFYDAYQEDDIYIDIQEMQAKHFAPQGLKLVFEGDSIFNKNKWFYSVEVISE